MPGLEGSHDKGRNENDESGDLDCAHLGRLFDEGLHDPVVGNGDPLGALDRYAAAITGDVVV
jgi:hypothetical protein